MNAHNSPFANRQLPADQTVSEYANYFASTGILRTTTGTQIAVKRMMKVCRLTPVQAKVALSNAVNR